METGEAITGLVTLIPIVMFGCFAFWKLQPVFFMFNGGIGLIAGCYMADIINGGATTNLTITYSLAFVGYGLVSIALAFWSMFRESN